MTSTVLSFVIVAILTAGPAFAQTRIAFKATTGPSGLIDAEQKARTDFAKDLAKDFTKHAKDDNVVVVEGENDADVVITVLHRTVRRGGFTGVYVRAYAGEQTEVELRAGSYTTKIKDRYKEKVAKKMRAWLKENRQTLHKKQSNSSQ